MPGETIERAARVTSIPMERMARLAQSGHSIFWAWGSTDPECACGWRGWGAGADFVAGVADHFDEVERTLLADAIAGAAPLDEAEQAFLEASYA